MNANQEHLLKMVLEIDELCRKHDIIYFLDYGSMLGAVRHEGFIPWDADVDISMTEENYNKFKEVCIKELDHKTRTFCDNRMNREFPSVYGHYIDLETCRMSGHTNFWDYYCGQSIDIFCLIEIPADEEERRAFIDRFYAYDEYCNESYMHYKRKTESVMSLIRHYQEEGERIGKENLLRKLEGEIFGREYDGCDTLMAASARGFDPTPLVPREAYQSVHETMFEGHMLPIPGGYGDLLTLFYGDSYNLFPAQPKKYSIMSNAGIPCRAYVDDFLEVVDRDRMLEDRLKYKNVEVGEGYLETQIQTGFYRALAIRTRNMLRRDIRELQLDVNEIIASGDRDRLMVLDRVFDGFFTKQLNVGLLYWRLHFAIGDDLEYAAMYLLFHIRNNRKAIDRLFWLRRENGLPLTEKMAALKSDMAHIRNIKKYLLYKDYEKAKEELDWALVHYPGSREVKTWYLQYLTETAEGPEDLAACSRYLDQLRQEAEEDMYMKKAEGDICYLSGQTEKAAEIYAQLKETSNDGMLLLDIRRKEEALKLQEGNK